MSGRSTRIIVDGEIVLAQGGAGGDGGHGLIHQAVGTRGKPGNRGEVVPVTLHGMRPGDKIDVAIGAGGLGPDGGKDGADGYVHFLPI